MQRTSDLMCINFIPIANKIANIIENIILVRINTMFSIILVILFAIKILAFIPLFQIVVWKIPFQYVYFSLYDLGTTMHCICRVEDDLVAIPQIEIYFC